MKVHLLVTASLDVLTDVIACLSENGFGDLIGIDDAATPVAAPVPAGAPVITPNAAAAGAVANVDLDATGLPWDERIHASTKTKKADGSWTRRRGVQDSEYIAVEAELRAQFPTTPPAGVPSAVTASPVVAASPVAEPVAAPVVAAAPVTGMDVLAPAAAPVAAPVVTAAPIPVAQPAPAPVAAPVPAAAPQPMGPPTTLHELMQHLGPLMDPNQGGRITAEYLNGVIDEVNGAWGPHLGGKSLTSLADIAAFPTLEIVPWIWQVFQRDGKIAA